MHAKPAASARAVRVQVRTLSGLRDHSLARRSPLRRGPAFPAPTAAERASGAPRGHAAGGSSVYTLRGSRRQPQDAAAPASRGLEAHTSRRRRKACQIWAWGLSWSLQA
jgi:hypothetical protein